MKLEEFPKKSNSMQAKFIACILTFYPMKQLRTLSRIVAFGTIISFSINISFVKLIEKYVPQEVNFDVDFLEKYSKSMEYFIVIFLAPVLETLIFQFLIIRGLLLLKFKYNETVAVCISAMAFSLNHTYNVYYWLIMLLVGIVFAFSFVSAHRKLKLGFLAVVLIHAFHNALTYIQF